MEKLLTSEYWAGVISAIFGWILSFLWPVWPFLILMIALTMTDLYTGTRAAKKRGEKINSRGLRRTVEKIVLYTAAILLCEGMKTVFFPALNITYIAAFTVCLTETKSNLENIYQVTGTDVWANVRDFILRKK